MSGHAITPTATRGYDEALASFRKQVGAVAPGPLAADPIVALASDKPGRGEHRAAARSCEVCGCTDTHACRGGCHWVGPTLCSACGEA